MFPGDFTVEGQYVHTITDNVAGIIEENYLFDSTAETALAASDFVFIQYRRVSTTMSTGGIDVVIDTQGDSGSGTQATSGNVTANECLWVIAEGSTIALPSSLFSANSTRTGRMKALDNAGVIGTPIDHEVFFTFCTVNNPSTNAFDFGNFTVNGGYVLQAGAANTNLSTNFDTTIDGYISASDFVIVNVTSLPGNNASTAVFSGKFSCAGDSGSATLAESSGTSSPADAIFYASSMNPVILPAAHFPTAQTTKVVVTQSPVTNASYMFNFCSWAL